MKLAEYKEKIRKKQIRRRGNTDEMVAESVEIVVFTDVPEIVAVLWWYDRQKSDTKPWGFLMKKKDLNIRGIYETNKGPGSGASFTGDGSEA